MFCDDQISVDMWYHAFRMHNRKSCHTLAATAETEITVEEDTVSVPLERQAVHDMFAYCLTSHHCVQMERMERSLESVTSNFASIRTGRANPTMLDRVKVHP